MLRRQSGFGVLGLLVVIVVLAAVGFAGWKVYVNSRSSADTTVVDTGKDSTDKVNPNTPTRTAYERTTQPPVSWKQYSDDAGKLSFFYPADWTVTKDVLEKQKGEAGQTTFTTNATKITTYCLHTDAAQLCSGQLLVFDQTLDDTVGQLRRFYKQAPEVTQYTFDGFPASKVTSTQSDTPGTDFFVEAHGMTYSLPAKVLPSGPDDTTADETAAALLDSVHIK
jgi:hypothetical protein